MRPLLLASANSGKLAEMHALLSDLPLTLLDPPSMGLAVEIEETGADYAENAQQKALAYARASGHWALADDSGLEVEALAGAPGLHSARLSGPGASDADRRAHLLRLLRPHPRPWTARFRSTLALASPQGEVDMAEGICLGEIIPEERGAGGFGYDPIFLVAGLERTMAELSMQEKNLVSHRARAVQAMLAILKQRLGSE